MPLPSEALTINGGCNCRATRYRIAIPALSDRPLHPNYDPSSKLSPVHLPYTFTDHCNDCRRATGSILNAWITTDISTVSAASLRMPTLLLDVKAAREGREEDAHRGPYLPAQEIFTGHIEPTSSAVINLGSKGKREMKEGKAPTAGSPLSFYESSPGTMRSFCSLCGTNLTYWAKQQPELLDIIYGTLDRDWLDSDNARPERHMWWSKGLGWVKEWVHKADPEMERHEGDDINDRMGK